MPPKYIHPERIDYLCEDCGTNIEDDTLWCPKCKHDVSVIGKPIYTCYQKLQICIQTILYCKKPVTLETIVIYADK
jgi:DNA-directed RNA polymerase subunit RPC12/RpoP